MKLLDKTMMGTYLRYVAPASLTFALSAVYAIVDGLFVGHAIGDAGLAAVNLAYPLFALTIAIGTGVGIGGAVISSIYAGSGNETASRRAIGHTLTMLVIIAPLVMAFMFAFNEQLLYLMGARDAVLENARRYMDIITLGSIVPVISAGCLPLLRNKGRVFFAMVISMIGGTMNVVSNYVMVFRLGWGVTGSALSTVISQSFVLICCLIFFFLKDRQLKLADFKPNVSLVKRSLRNGFAPFALTLLPEVTTISINISCGAYGGSVAQAAFGIISFTGVGVEWIIQGINDGSQPLISRFFGKGDGDMVGRLRMTNFLFAVGVGLLGAIALVVFRQQLVLIFGVSEEAGRIFKNGIALFAVSLPFYGLNHAITSNFYAMECGRYANTLAVLEALGIAGVAYLAPLAFGLSGCWATVSIVQVCLLPISLGLLIRKLPTLSFTSK